MNVLKTAAVAAAMMTASVSFAQVELNSDEDKFSYAIGVQVGQQLFGSFEQENLSADVLTAAIKDVLNENELALTNEQITEIMTKKQQEATDKQAAVGEENRAKSEAFLAENAKRDGIVVTDTGVQYEVLASGEADAAQPTAESQVVVHYKGETIDGNEFDSSYKRGEPITLPVNGVIDGWKEVLPMMRVGDKWKIYIPSDLAYGERGAGADIGPNQALVFEIELQEIK